jgi:TPR repeat protein
MDLSKITLPNCTNSAANINANMHLELAKKHYKNKDYLAALPYLGALAGQNNSWALHCLGEIYYFGHQVKKNYVIAAQYYKDALTQGNTDAFYNLGFCNLYGYGVIQNYSEGVKCFKTYLETNASGSAAEGACHALGHIYLLGLGVTQNTTTALHYFEMAAAKNLARSWYKLGVLYRDGHGVSINSIKTNECFRQALKLGLDGQKTIQDYQVHLLQRAEKDQQDKEYSHAFFMLLVLAQENMPEAKTQLVRMCLDKLITDEENLKLAIPYLKELSSEGDLDALDFLVDLGKSFVLRSQSTSDDKKPDDATIGNEIRLFAANVKPLEVQQLIDTKQFEIALAKLKKLAIHNNGWAQFKLGKFYCFAWGVTQDFSLSFNYFQKSAENNYASSWNELGNMYLLGLGVKQDFIKAQECYKEAINRKAAFGFYNMGMVYRHGLGVPKDEIKAGVYFQTALELKFSPTIEEYEQKVEEYEQKELNLVRQYVKEGKYQRAFVLALYLAQHNNPEAQFLLGKMYLCGLGVDKELDKAIHYFNNANKNGYTSSLWQGKDAEIEIAIMNLSSMADAGTLDTNSASSKAAFWAAELIVARSISDKKSALKYYKKAADGEKGEDNFYGKASYKYAMLSYETKTNLQTIPVYLKKAYEQGYPDALTACMDLSEKFATRYETSMLPKKDEFTLASDLGMVVLNLKQAEQFKKQVALELAENKLREKANQILEKTAVDQLFHPKCVIPARVETWYSEHKADYANIALQLAKIRYEQNSSTESEKVIELIDEVLSARLSPEDNSIKLDLVEWYLSNEDKESARNLLEQINITEVSMDYPKTQQLFNEMRKAILINNNG